MSQPVLSCPLESGGYPTLSSFLSVSWPHPCHHFSGCYNSVTLPMSSHFQWCTCRPVGELLLLTCSLSVHVLTSHSLASHIPNHIPVPKLPEMLSQLPIPSLVHKCFFIFWPVASCAHAGLHSFHVIISPSIYSYTLRSLSCSYSPLLLLLACLVLKDLYRTQAFHHWQWQGCTIQQQCPWLWYFCIRCRALGLSDPDSTGSDTTQTHEMVCKEEETLRAHKCLHKHHSWVMHKLQIWSIAQKWWQQAQADITFPSDWVSCSLLCVMTWPFSSHHTCASYYDLPYRLETAFKHSVSWWVLTSPSLWLSPFWFLLSIASWPIDHTLSSRSLSATAAASAPAQAPHC